MGTVAIITPRNVGLPHGEFAEFAKQPPRRSLTHSSDERGYIVRGRWGRDLLQVG